MRVTPQVEGNAFFVFKPDAVTGKPVRWATPLVLALVMVEIIDPVFAVDSVPAIFAITNDPFIVYTSNIFAILGLRVLYFALAAIIGKIPPVFSLSVTFGLIAGGVLVTLWKTRGQAVQMAIESK